MKRFITLLLPVVWLIIILLPALVFLQTRDFNIPARTGVIFPLFGLIAFALIWSQIMLGSFMRPLEKLYPKILTLHIIQGVKALLFALLHPFLLFLSLPAIERLDFLMFKIGFVDPSLVGYVYLAEAALLLLILGLAAGALRNWPPLKRYWHWVHLVHYIVFFLVFFHSWNLGTDIQSSPILRPLWYFFFGTVVLGLVYRRWYIPKKEGLVASTS